MQWPTDPAERQALRQRAMDRAAATALLYGRTITCREYPDHSTCKGISVCLCPCHDPQAAE